MKVYVLIDSGDGDVEVDVFADKDEAVQTAGIRAEEQFNRWREDKLSAHEISRMGSLVSDDTDIVDYPENFGLNDSMVACGWVWYCRTYDDGDNYRIVERELIK